MTQENLIKRIAQKTGYWDYANTQVFTGKDIREADMLDALNDKYEEVYTAYSAINPEFYETESTANTRETNGTISSVSGSTLVATSAIFTSDMTDGVIRDTTQDSTMKIKTYTSTTQIELEDDAPDDWAASDSIDVFTGIYTFGGDLTDIYGYPLWVGIKYNTTDDDFARCKLYSDSQAYRTGRGRDKDDIFVESDPIYTLSKVVVDDADTSAIRVKPIPDTAIAGGVYIKYNQSITALSDDDAVPRLPLKHHKFLSDGAIAELCFGHLDDPEKGSIYEQKYQDGLMRLEDSVFSGDEVRRVTLEQHLDDFRTRTR